MICTKYLNNNSVPKTVGLRLKLYVVKYQLCVLYVGRDRYCICIIKILSMVVYRQKKKKKRKKKKKKKKKKKERKKERKKEEKFLFWIARYRVYHFN